MRWGGWLDPHSSCGLDQWRGVLLTRVDPVDISSMSEGISHGGEGWRMPSSSKQQGPRVQAAQVIRGWFCLGGISFEAGKKTLSKVP